MFSELRKRDSSRKSQSHGGAVLIRVEEVVSAKELKRAFSIRLRVFVREQGVPQEIELDRDDRTARHFLATVRGRARTARHFLATVRGRAVGTARLVVKNGRAKIGRMAVLKSYRGKGVGKALLKRAVESARKKKVKMIYLHAQVPVIGFYEKMGFQCVGRLFMEAGIPHRKMVFSRPGEARG
ncbi:MAG: GNAT family N-acetyltransferase [Deltaproteobacteria bacterium]|nr:GNAT family N-acetyltransferase [Deltaproteobacteria bacterium]